MVCPHVRGDDTHTLASGLSAVHVLNDVVTILFQYVSVDLKYTLRFFAFKLVKLL